MTARQVETRHRWAGVVATLAIIVTMGCSGEPAMHPDVTRCMEDEACVVLKSIDSRVTDQGIELEPTEFDDPSRYTAVSVQADGTSVVRVGQSPTPGYLIIRDVPPGPYYLQVDGYYQLHDERFVDWSNYSLTRADTKVVKQRTILELDLRGLEPWETGDHLHLEIPSLRHIYVLPVFPDEGSEGLVASLDYAELEVLFGLAPLQIDGNRGDRVLITQRSNSLPKRVLRVPPFVLSEGEAFRITGSLEPIESIRRTIDCRLPELESMLQGLVPGEAPFTDKYLFLYTAPPELAGRPDGSIALLSGSLIDHEVTTLEYANPMSPNWVDWLECYVKLKSNDFPGLYASIRFRQSLDQAVATPAGPVVGPVGNIRLNGQDASTPLSGVSLTPTISWDAPALGDATAYQVVVLEMRDAFPELLAWFWLEGPQGTSPPTQMILPPDILSPTRSYVLSITAIARPNDTEPPSRAALARPEGTALRMTGAWTP
jgi:hypothetical protein